MNPSFRPCSTTLALLAWQALRISEIRTEIGYEEQARDYFLNKAIERPEGEAFFLKAAEMKERRINLLRQELGG